MEWDEHILNWIAVINHNLKKDKESFTNTQIKSSHDRFFMGVSGGGEVRM